MYHFFVEPEQIGDEIIRIEGPDVNHIKNVLRMKQGEEVLISSRAGGDYACAIDSYEEDCVIAQIRYEEAVGRELPADIILFQGLPKGDKMEMIIQKNVELGVHAIVPVAMKRCVVKLDDKKAAKKIERWQQISESAAKQSKRGIVPKIYPVMSLKEAIAFAKDFEHKLLPYENAEGIKRTRELLGKIRAGEKTAVFIGPEGGFDKDEVELAVGAGFETMTLGRRILRTETAGMMLLSVMSYTLEED